MMGIFFAHFDCKNFIYLGVRAGYTGLHIRSGPATRDAYRLLSIPDARLLQKYTIDTNINLLIRQ